MKVIFVCKLGFELFRSAFCFNLYLRLGKKTTCELLWKRNLCEFEHASFHSLVRFARHSTTPTPPLQVHLLSRKSLKILPLNRDAWRHFVRCPGFLALLRSNWHNLCWMWLLRSQLQTSLLNFSIRPNPFCSLSLLALGSGLRQLPSEKVLKSGSMFPPWKRVRKLKLHRTSSRPQ
jgi:hypothetical protein